MDFRSSNSGPGPLNVYRWKDRAKVGHAADSPPWINNDEVDAIELYMFHADILL